MEEGVNVTKTEVRDTVSKLSILVDNNVKRIRANAEIMKFPKSAIDREAYQRHHLMQITFEEMTKHVSIESVREFGTELIKTDLYMVNKKDFDEIMKLLRELVTKALI